jgi:dephospho-CoA kinase
MLKIGITGGIGSGKSTVCHLFSLLGIPVYDADSRAKILMNSDPEIIKSVKKHFGKETYDKEDNLNRKLLGSIVFNDLKKLNLLNSIIHPEVQKDHERWHLKQENCSYTIKEAALLFESGSYKKLDLIILVSAPLELRIQRTMQRDHTTRSEVMARLKKQWPETRRKKTAQLFLLNDEQHSIIEQVSSLHAYLCNLASK